MRLSKQEYAELNKEIYGFQGPPRVFNIVLAAWRRRRPATVVEFLEMVIKKERKLGDA